MIRFIKKKNKFYQSQKGASSIEFLFCFFVYVLAVALLYGSFGVVHSSILNSIGARTYAFFNIRNRSDISVKGRGSAQGLEYKSYLEKGSRFFAITTYQTDVDIGTEGPQWVMPSLAMDFIGHRNQVQINASQSGGGIMQLDLNDRDNIDSWSGGLVPEARFSGQRPSGIVYQIQGYGICVTSSCEPKT